MNIRIATCLKLPEADPDEAPLASAFCRAGITAVLCGWDDPTVNWNEPIPTLLRSTWNYTLHPDKFLSWCKQVASVAPLINPFDVVVSNLHKRYLIELGNNGIDTVPTILVCSGEQIQLHTLCKENKWDKFVIKPAIGAASRSTKAFSINEIDEAIQHLQLLSQTEDVLIQPYMHSVDDYGERSLVFIDGELSHAVRKAPRFSGNEESVTGPFPITEDERALALAAIKPWTNKILYGRIDIARGSAGNPMVMELELVEPSLFFDYKFDSVDHLVKGLINRLRFTNVW